MESERLYRGIFYGGGGWNLLASIPTAFLISTLPSMLQIEAPRYPVFIYFNLMTMVLFAFVHFTVARNLGTARPYVKILVWSKMLTVVVFVAGIIFMRMPAALIEFLAPAISIDLILGAIFWRYLVFSAKQTA